MVNSLAFTPVRRTHLIEHLGPGALQLSQNGVCGIICGPPIWLESLKAMDATTAYSIFENQTIRDSHMERPMGVDRLVAPWPVGDNPTLKTDWIVPAARFPLYEYCRNHSCRALVHREDPSDHKEGHCDRCATSNRRKWTTVQVPVVLACVDGHLADVPWSRWVHRVSGPDCRNPNDLQFQPGSLPDQPLVKCRSCLRQRTLSRDDEFPCSGERPWLPGLPPEECAKKAQVLERTSTTIYYPTALSSLTIPERGIDNPKLVHLFHTSSAIRSQRRTYERSGSEASVEEIVSICARLGVPTDVEQVKRHIAALNVERNNTEDRSRELDALLAYRPAPKSGFGFPDLIVEPQNMASYGTNPIVAAFDAVSLVPRLREVRVLTGFHRVRPPADVGSVNYEQLWGEPMPKQIRDGDRKGWLPAFEVFGEGIFFQLDEQVVDDWEHSIERIVRKRAMVRARTPRKFLVHTLAHMVMRAAAPYAGYLLPSLRERLYEVDGRLAFLIYTAAGDIQGTLGGLVELGRPGRLELLLEEAVERIRWCSTDPVCIEDGIELGLSGTTQPGACHHCILVPETSCERGNRILDRAAVIGIEGLGSLNGL